MSHLSFRWGAAGGLLDGLQGSEEDEDNDALKEAILETNPILLVLTVVVSILHSVFEFLAFKNGIHTGYLVNFDKHQVFQLWR